MPDIAIGLTDDSQITLFNLLMKYSLEDGSKQKDGSTFKRKDGSTFRRQVIIPMERSFLPVTFKSDDMTMIEFPSLKFIRDDLIILYGIFNTTVAIDKGYGFKFAKIYHNSNISTFNNTKNVASDIEYAINKIIDAEIRINYRLSGFSSLSGSDIYKHCYDYLLYGYGDGSMIRPDIGCNRKQCIVLRDGHDRLIIDSRKLEELVFRSLSTLPLPDPEISIRLAITKYILGKVLRREYNISGIYKGIDISCVKSARKIQ